MSEENKMENCLAGYPKGWTEKLERAGLRLRAEQKDWERNFKSRMSFDEYKFRQYLGAEVTTGNLGIDRAIAILSEYREASASKEVSE